MSVAGLGASRSSLVGKTEFQILAKPNGSVCNLNCTYCFFLTKERLYPGGLFLMGDDILKTYLRQSMQGPRALDLTLIWGGGEPAMTGLDFFKRAIDYEKEYAQPGARIVNEFQTNGTLLDNAWCEFFHSNQVEVALSIDGPRPLHNAYRHDKQGQPTFEETMAGFQLLQQHNIEYNILCSVHAANVDYPLEIYRFFRDELEGRSIRFTPIVERDNNTGFQEGDGVTDRSVDPKRYGEFLIAIFDEWMKHDTARVRISVFDDALANWVGMPAADCSFSASCGSSPALEHNGDLYCCEHFVEPNYFLGNMRETSIAHLLASERQIAFGQNKLALPRHCRECEVLFACHGECPKNRFTKSPDGEPGLNYLCSGYKAFFKHVTWPVEVMAQLLGRRS
ncbi:MAG: anaerobic sulfatase maturase [Candidatus Solincola sediminis]|uniref:Anaerobic sulfatase maturase n=1 Tax=Candidatus Solincola sediminis TaxID=1797199 RepID=A0A1F2WJC6_9ACTN|nr:MAG: anaerobic sulfatase maturase [Candidatus Solincola sediminis]OFW61084.1 MAG: anaerobic sulfatase maturase [Candidatus Solincola sediminis]